MSLALSGLSATMLASDDPHGAEQTASDALKTAEELGDVAVTIAALISAGRVAFADGRPSAGLSVMTRALSLAESTDALPDQAEVLIGLGECAHEAAGSDAAERYCERGLALARRIGAEALIARGLLARSRLAVLGGDEPGADDRLGEALAVARTVPCHVVAEECVMEAATRSLVRADESFDRLHRVAVLVGWIEGRRHRDQPRLGRGRGPQFATLLARLQEILGPTGFDQAIVAGRAITTESAVAQAMLLLSG
jgi:hypothetical protein